MAFWKKKRPTPVTSTARGDQIAAARRERATKDGRHAPAADVSRLQKIAEHNNDAAELGAKIGAVLKGHPYPPDTIVYVLEMLKHSVLKQMNGG